MLYEIPPEFTDIPSHPPMQPPAPKTTGISPHHFCEMSDVGFPGSEEAEQRDERFDKLGAVRAAGQIIKTRVLELDFGFSESKFIDIESAQSVKTLRTRLACSRSD